MRLAAISLSDTGAAVLAHAFGPDDRADMFLHESVAAHWEAKRFSRIVDVSKDIFSRYEALVYVAPCGVVVRCLDGCVRHKKTDPAVVVIDIGARYAISLLGGHEGGANELALRIANRIGAEPVITTSSEAAKNLIVGIGCRKHVAAGRIIDAIRESLHSIDASIDAVRLLATADIKATEPGLTAAAQQLGIPLRIIASEEILHTNLPITHSRFVAQSVGLPAVAEPAALLAGRRTRLRLPKTAYNGITIAIAEENCTWSA